MLYVDAYHHERETHRRAAHQTHARAAAASRMRDIDATFERRVRAWTIDERLRQAWRNAFHHAAPPPLLPAPVPKLLFRGRSVAGAELTAMASARGDVDVFIDGNHVRRMPSLGLRTERGRTELALGPDLVFEERFAASHEALDALRRWVADPSGGPPIAYAVDLAADGLLDRHYELTARGRRAVAAPAMAEA
ncbi:MAG: hypothetical protein Q8P41_09900 [Pseudomonadota bacterium]|nr:hypothetical protein [Pseudomonadota bacterium]